VASPSERLRLCLKLSEVDFEIESANALSWARIVVELECDLVCEEERKMKNSLSSWSSL